MVSPNNASKWKMEFIWAFKGLIHVHSKLCKKYTAYLLSITKNIRDNITYSEMARQDADVS
jgi:hypothetical protein